MCCVVIIEEKEAIDNLDAIAETPGIDLLFIGTSDLSFSLTGDKRNVDTPPVVAAMDRVIEVGKKHGIRVGCPAGSAAQMSKFVDRGFTFFQAAPDTVFLKQGVNAFTSSLEDAGLRKQAGHATKRRKVNGAAAAPAQVC